MVKISACVITKNEEKHIERWLDTMRKITQDLIVVDTGSTDRTVELAKAGGARVYHFEWIDDFAAAKNYAIEQAKGDWILFLDADEFFTEASLLNVRQLIEKHHRNRKIEVFVCKMIDVDTDRDNALLDEFYNVRIFRNVPWLRYENKVHEMLRKSNGKINLTVVPDGIEILHTGYTQSLVTKKLKRNLAILQQEIAEVGEQERHYRFLSDCYYGLDQYELALKYAKLHTASDRRSLGRDNTMEKRVIDCLDLMKAGEEEIMAEIDAQMAAHPDDSEYLWYKAEYLARLGQHAQAELYFAKMFALREKEKADLDISRFEARKVRVFVRLAEIAERKGDFVAAEASYRQAVRCQKYDGALFLGWYRWLRQKDPVETIAALREIYGKTERELVFVYGLLQRFPDSKVHIYYRRLLKETLDMQAVTSAATDFFSAGQYEKATAALGETLQDEYARLLLCTALDGKRQNESELQLLLPERHKRVLSALRGEKIALEREEAILLQDLQNHLAACRGDVEQPIERLRTQYVQARQWMESVTSRTVVDADAMRLLRFVEPGEQPLHILAIDCGGEVLAQLEMLWPRAVFRKMTTAELEAEEENSYQWIVLGEPLNAYRKPVLLLKRLYSMLQDGFLLFTVENVLYWERLQQLLQKEQKLSVLKSMKIGDASFTPAMLIECMRDTKFSDVAIDAEEATPTAEADTILAKLQSAGFLEDARDFYTQRWHVRAGKVNAVTYALQSVMSQEERRELVFLLRRAENDIDARENMQAVLQFCREKKVEAPYLAALIDNSMIQKTKLFAQLATFFFEQGAQQTAIRMLIAALRHHAQEAEFVCVLALLLQLSGARQEALKVLAQFSGEDANVEALRKELTA